MSVVYNGATGGLGKFFQDAALGFDIKTCALSSRLEDVAGLSSELRKILALQPLTELTFVMMAAKVSVPDCEKDPQKAFHINVDQTLASAECFLNETQKAGCSSRILYVSTGHVYASAAVGHRIQENDPLGPRSIYAQSKAQAEQKLIELSQLKQIPLLIARVFGLIAPGQANNYILPGLIQRIRQRRLTQIPGLDFVRDYLDSRDVCSNIFRLCQCSDSQWRGLENSLVNICSGEAVSIRDLAEFICTELEVNTKELTAAPGRPDDVPWIVGDPGRLERLTGLSAKSISLQTTILEALNVSQL